jgi:hypothetical protein
MVNTVYVGIATTSHNTTTATDAVLDNFKVTPSGSASNQPPNVGITSPADGSTFTAGTDIMVNAAANDADGTVSRVDFFAGTTQIGSSTTAPYSAKLSGAAAGTYSLTAVAVDNDGSSTTSATVSIRVNPAANQPPTINLTAPANGATYTAPASMTLSASPADSDGTVAKVEFYNGTTLLNTDTTAPYSFTWSSVAAGTYAVKAIAYDNSGASASSASITITVATATITPPTGVVFTASPDHATLVTRYELRIYASGADPNTATPIATSDLGKPTPDANNDITVDRSAFFSALAVGNYGAAVAAIGSGGSSISAGVTFTR